MEQEQAEQKLRNEEQQRQMLFGYGGSLRQLC